MYASLISDVFTTRDQVCNLIEATIRVYCDRAVEVDWAEAAEELGLMSDVLRTLADLAHDAH